MRWWTTGKDGLSPEWKVDEQWMWDNHIKNIIKHVRKRENQIFTIHILKILNEEMKRRMKEGTRWAVKDTWERVPPEVKCLKCNEIISSKREGNFVWCSCWATGIDSTVYYTRILGNKEDHEEVPVHLLPGEFTYIEDYHEYVKQARETFKKKREAKSKANQALSGQVETDAVIK